jgi:ribosomal protein S18 acetylase RimI-like enzyme
MPLDDLVVTRLAEVGERNLDELTDVLIAVVEQGASVGFLPPLTRSDAARYWVDVPGPNVILMIARHEGRIVGTAQLHLASRPNARHRAEVAKVLVDPRMQRRGIGRALMVAVEEAGREAGRTLLVLDTRLGDGSNDLYRSLGYVEAGRIPEYALSANGQMDATVFYYKHLLGERSAL